MLSFFLEEQIHSILFDFKCKLHTAQMVTVCFRCIKEQFPIPFKNIIIELYLKFRLKKSKNKKNKPIQLKSDLVKTELFSSANLLVVALDCLTIPLK